MEVEHYAAVPSIDGDSLLVVDGRLPTVRGEWQRFTDLLDAFAPLIGRPRYLRVAAHAEVAPERALRLRAFDASPVGGTWVRLDEARPDRLVPPELRPALERWLAEQQGAPVPPARSPWARPGWHDEAEAWAGCGLEQLRLWPLSAVLRGRLDGEPVYLKAVFSGFHHEPAVTEALARAHTGLVPDVVGIDEARGLLLMRELEGTPGYELECADAVFETLAAIQEAWRSRTDELRRLGAPDRTLPVLAASIAELVETAAPELAHAVGPLEGACRSLEPDATIVHGDFHGGNVVVDRRGRAVIFDWSDTCIAHPSLDRYIYLDSYAEPDAVAACLHQAVSYRDIVAALEPDDRWWFDAEPRRWVERAAALVT